MTALTEARASCDGETQVVPISFFVACVPVAQPRGRAFVVGGKARVFSAPSKHPVQLFKASIRHEFRVHYSGPPLNGAIALEAMLLFPRPGRLRWKKRPMPRVQHVSKPDCENCGKALLDSLTGIAFFDDAQVSDLRIRKRYASGDEQPGVAITITRDDGSDGDHWHKPGSIVEAFEAMRKAGGGAWDRIDDSEEFLGR